FFLQAEAGIRDWSVTGVQTCALPICSNTVPVHGYHGVRSADSRARSQAVPLRARATRAGSKDCSRLSGSANRRGPRAGTHAGSRSEERRVGKEGGARGGQSGEKEKEM